MYKNQPRSLLYIIEVISFWLFVDLWDLSIGAKHKDFSQSSLKVIKIVLF